MESQIVIKPSFDANSTFKATLLVYKNSRLFIYLIVIFIIMSISVSTNASHDKYFWVPLVTVYPLVVIWFVYRIYAASKKQLTDNPRLQEDITHVFTANYFQEKGESFDIKYFWKDIVKLEEKNDLFLIYIKKNQAKFIKKSDLKNNQYNELKALFNSLNIKKSLK
jgi:hypothetical protein